MIKKDRFFFIFKIHLGQGGYFEGILWTSTKSTLHYYELNYKIWFSLIIFFHSGGRRRTCFVPGCRPPPGTSRFKFPRNKKKKKLWLSSLKIDETIEIGDSRVCSLHFTKSDFKPNLSTFSELPEISSARKFLLSSAIPSITVKETRSPSGTLKKLNHKRIITELLEMEEMEMSIVQEETTCSVQTQTDLTMEEIFDLESAKNSLKHAETKTNKKKMVSNFLVDQDIKDYDEFLEARDNSNDESDEDTNDNGSTNEVLHYISGFIANKLKSVHPNLVDSSQQISSKKWIKLKCRGNLVIPSRELFFDCNTPGERILYLSR